jgi:hypothetical protein
MRGFDNRNKSNPHVAADIDPSQPMQRHAKCRRSGHTASESLQEPIFSPPEIDSLANLIAALTQRRR